ncbi:hypothetical protein [Alkaliphilus metalliredigens]|uniref:hypothetical protein n=1 Tax=Alkaliphilus metalliredigens TaxID=208226 RepID=UPI00005CAD78|nr:hypothetical protein [Alkaliphilus metalliredigens]
MHKRVIFHIDANSAYLSWEAVYRLQQGETVDLRKVPQLLEEMKKKGMVLC